MLHQAIFRAGEFRFSAALMIGASSTIFATLPAIVFGLPAVILLRRRGADKAKATIALTVGGAIVGWLLLSGSLETFKSWGALIGASIGLMMGVLMLSSPRTGTANA